MKNRILTILKYILFLGFGVFLVWWSIHKMDEKNWEDCKNALKTARYWLFIPVFFILSASHVSRAIRWKILMKPMGYNPSLLNTFFAVMVGYLANLAIPRLGEVLKCTILGKYEKVPPEKLVGTIIIERAVDVISLGTVFIIALITQAGIIGDFAKNTINTYFLTDTKQGLMLKISLLLLVLVASVFLIRFISKKYGHNKIIHRLNNLFKGVVLGLSSVKNMENKKSFIFHSIFIWVCYVLGTYIGFYALTETSDLPIASTFPVLAFASIGMIITPGGIGTYALFIMQVMSLYNIEEGIGFANGNLQWMAQFLIVLCVGFISLISLPYYNKGKLKLSGKDEEITAFKS